ncbi:MAG: hypothetical protein RH917_01180 [Lacipirellulaceae bacterium]
MIRILFAMMVAVGLAVTSGCGCCSNLFGSRTTAARPIMAPAGPVCAPSCNSCDACSGGASYGQPYSGTVLPAGPTEGYPVMMPPG